MKMKNFLNNILKSPKPAKVKSKEKGTSGVFCDRDNHYMKWYSDGLLRTDTPPSKPRIGRFSNLVQFFNQVKHLDGRIAECGCWKGLSSYIILQACLQDNPGYKGEDYHIFDSFEGLSAPTAEDAVTDKKGNVLSESAKPQGYYNAQLTSVQNALSQFNAVTYHKGWIPDSFKSVDEGFYKFVHADLDFYAPTIESLKYFYDRLVPGGLIVVDDYGSNKWPGVILAVESFCSDRKINPILLSSNQAVIWKKK